MPGEGISDRFSSGFDPRFELFSDGSRRRHGRSGARSQREVTGHYIDNHGYEHQHHANPETPITVSAFPVRNVAVMNTVVILPVLLVTVLAH
jgi:hypothetical protein